MGLIVLNAAVLAARAALAEQHSPSDRCAGDTPGLTTAHAPHVDAHVPDAPRLDMRVEESVAVHKARAVRGCILAWNGRALTITRDPAHAQLSVLQHVLLSRGQPAPT